MIDHGIVPDDVRGAFPWGLGQGTTDALIEHAYRQRATLAVDIGGKAHRVAVGSTPVGLLHADSLDFIRWPAVIERWDEADEIAWLHALADKSKTHALCYFIGGADGPVKIGYSIDVTARLAAIRSHSPVPVGILATRAGGVDRETAYHRQFAAHRLHGEWFSRSPEILSEIERLGGGA